LKKMGELGGTKMSIYRKCNKSLSSLDVRRKSTWIVGIFVNVIFSVQVPSTISHFFFIFCWRFFHLRHQPLTG
jgi:hypothetical protein